MSFHSGTYDILPQRIRIRRFSQQLNSRQDMLGQLLLVIALNGWWGSIPFSLFGVILGLDPYKYVFEEFLPHPTHRSIGIIIGFWIARLILATLSVSEFVRFITFLFFIIALATLMCVSCLTKILTIPGNSCFQFYTQLRIIFAWGCDVISNPIGYLTLFTHFSTIFFFWFGIRCWNFDSLFLALVSVSTGIFLVVYDTIIFIKSGAVQQMAECIITTRSTKHFSRRDNIVDRRYYFYLLWRSQFPVGVPCGSFFTIGRGFAMAYLRELANNLTNAILLIQPMSL